MQLFAILHHPPDKLHSATTGVCKHPAQNTFQVWSSMFPIFLLQLPMSDNSSLFTCPSVTFCKSGIFRNGNSIANYFMFFTAYLLLNCLLVLPDWGNCVCHKTAWIQIPLQQRDIMAGTTPGTSVCNCCLCIINYVSCSRTNNVLFVFKQTNTIRCCIFVRCLP